MKRELTPWQRWVIANTYPDPGAALDFIERVNDLPDTETTIRGVWDGGPAPDTETEPE